MGRHDAGQGLESSGGPWTLILGSLTAVRLSRLPNCERGQIGELQELYYLNPQPEAKPLLHE